MRRLIPVFSLVAFALAAPLTSAAQTAPPGLVEAVIPQTPAPPSQAPTPAPSQGRGQASPPAAQAPAAPRAPRAPQLGGPMLSAATNIRLDMAITDTLGGAPVKKTVSLVMLNGNGGMIRTRNQEHSAELNVDALANAYTSGLISLQVTFAYIAPMQLDDQGRRRSAPELNESITVVLVDGKPMVVSQSADPATDRKVTVELTATVLK